MQLASGSKHYQSCPKNEIQSLLNRKVTLNLLWATRQFFIEIST